jgi:hypothetical protein
MNGVAYSSLPSYGAKSDGYAVPVNGKMAAYPRVNADFLHRMVQHTQPQTQPPMIKEAPTLETNNQTKHRDSSTPSYLQVPPSINNGKGNLPDFAAQVSLPGVFGTVGRLTLVVDDLPLLV